MKASSLDVDSALNCVRNEYFLLTFSSLPVHYNATRAIIIILTFANIAISVTLDRLVYKFLYLQQGKVAQWQGIQNLRN